MANFPRQFPSGAPSNGALPSSAVDAIDAAMPKVPNATDGSSHNGSCRFGGLKATHVTLEQLSTTTSGAGPHAISWDFDVAGTRYVKVATQATDQVLNVTLSNFRAGDQGVLVVKKMDGANRKLTVNFLGTGVLSMISDRTVDNDAQSEAFTRWEVRCAEDADLPGVVAHVHNLGTYRLS